jgi:hypothetical protein
MKSSSQFKSDESVCESCLQAQRGMWKFRSSRTLGSMEAWNVA